MIRRLLALAGLLLAFPGYAASPFRPVETSAEAARLGTTPIRARAVRPFLFDARAFADAMRGVSVEKPDEVGTPSTLLELPHPDGGLARFRVIESPVMAAELAAKFPETRTFRGEGIDDPTASVRFDVSPRGFSAMVLSAFGAWYVDPWAPGEADVVGSYHRRDALRDPENTFRCEGPAKGPAREVLPFPSVRTEAGPTQMPLLTVGGTLKTYKLALATTGEYSAFFGGTVPLVHAELVTAVNRVTGIYERELGVRMTLVANNDSLIYLNGSTDPYTNSDGGAMLGQNQANVDAVIGSANYDIGHVFSTGGGGIAMLEAVCWTGYKAQGVTGSSSPTGDAFWVDYVAHEMGHQFGGNHTFDGTAGSCGGGNRNDATAYEVGSGSTIMAYAGICGSEDLQPHSDPYFHAVSFDEIVTYISNTSPDYGGACPTSTSTGNTAPTVSAGADYRIPARTPFALTGSATDPNGDTLTYGWEEMDLDAGSGTTGPPLTDNGSRPIFRSFDPTTSPTRTFPTLADVLAGTTTYGETLPTTTRTLTFRLTARDNRAGGGGVNSDTAVLSVTDTGSAFAVTSPSTAVSWPAGSTQTVTWNVAGTTAAPISCANVKIELSTDGGLTFGTTLFASTPNDGSEAVTLPSYPTAGVTARLKVSCVGNVFFAISRPSFTITTSPAAPTVTGISPATGSTAGGTAVTITGTGFVSGATVSIGGAAATSVVVSSATTITAVTGARAAGTVDVVVTNPGGASGTKSLAYTYVAPGAGLLFYTVTPCRVLDTRNAPDGPLAGPILAASPAERVFTIVTACGVPADAKVVSANVSVTGGTAAGSLRVYPSDGSLPVPTVISFGAGKTRANNAMLLVSTTGGAGRITVRNDATAPIHVILDVNGYFR
ncbi:MAG: M12 family metallo-peptidase [Thermoanaerobaculia bacterium]